MALPATASAQLATTPTPYGGWNTYYQVGGSFNESTIKSVANSLISTGLTRAGYKIVWLDFGWASGARDSSGNLIIDSTQWPDGMAGLTAWLHSQGLQAGIYTDAGTSGCSNSGVGSYGNYAAGSTNPYSQDVNQFAAWGFDAIKVDFCGAGQQWLDQPPHDPRTLYGQFSQAVAATGSWAPQIAQSWRTDTDIGYGGGGGIPWWAVKRNLDQNSTPQPDIQNAAGPPSASIAWGHWNDPDYLGPGLGMTETQARSQFSMWAMLAAPLILGSDPRALSSTSIKMLENSQVIAVDRDSLGAQGTLLSQSNSGQVWFRPLANGARAVALFNRGASALQIRTTASAVGLQARTYKLTNLWTNKTTTTTGNISANVPPDAVVLYRVTPS